MMSGKSDVEWYGSYKIDDKKMELEYLYRKFIFCNWSFMIERSS